MTQKRVSLQIPAFVLLISTLACAAKDGGGVTGPGAETAGATAGSVSAVIDALRGAGLNVEAAGTLQQPFFTPPAQVFTVDGRDLQLYEFATPATAAEAAAQVAPAGGSVGTVSMSWMAPPHFFRKDRLIAIYLGTSPKTLAELERLFGPQFAGR